MKFSNIEEYSKHVDKIISDNVNNMLNIDKFNEVFELTLKEINKENIEITQKEFENICQISSAIVKGMSKHIIYATLESINQINSTRPDH